MISVVLSDSPQCKMDAKVWHVEEGLQRQTVWRRFTGHRGSSKYSLMVAAIRAKGRFVYAFVLWHFIGASWLMSSSTVLYSLCFCLISCDNKQISHSKSPFLSSRLQSAVGRLLLQSPPAPHPSPSSRWRCRAAQSQPRTYTLTIRTVAARPTANQDAATHLTVSVASAQAVWQRGPGLP